MAHARTLDVFMATFGAAMVDLVRRAVPLVPVFVTIHDYGVSIKAVSGRSMQPTFNARGSDHHDFVLLDKWSARSHAYERGDVVVLRSPAEPGELLTKRIVGIQGDWVYKRTGSYGIVQARAARSARALTAPFDADARHRCREGTYGSRATTSPTRTTRTSSAPSPRASLTRA